MEIIQKIEQQLKENPIILYMKGNPQAPQCGFSAQAVQILSACGAKFAYVDILQDPELRAALKEYANWPTYPQLYLQGELVGGVDIMTQLYEQGKLQQMVEAIA
jgi:monothiol glutaredoxin